MQISTQQTGSHKTNWTHTGAGNCTCDEVHDPADSFVPSEPRLGARGGNLPSPQSLYHRAESLTLRQNIPDIPTYGSMSLPGSRDTVARSDYPHGLLGAT